MTKYTLNYFPFGGRALAARLMFTVAGEEFTDNQIPYAEWSLVQSDETKFPLNQMPTLEVDDYVICQSQAIYRYLGNELGFYGDNNKDKAEIDQICETSNEYLTAALKIIFDKGFSDEEKNAKLNEYFNSDGYLKKLAFIAKVHKRSGIEKFFIGEKLSIADLTFLAIDEIIRPKYSLYLESQPELEKLLQRIRDVDVIKKYMDKK